MHCAQPSSSRIGQIDEGDGLTCLLDAPVYVSRVHPATIILFPGSLALSLDNSLAQSFEDLMPGCELRAYDALQPNIVGFPKDNNLPIPHYLVVNAMTPTPQSEIQFNAWYDDEHLPLLRRVPGWMSSVRYQIHANIECKAVNEGSIGNSLRVGDAPRYLALHCWSGKHAFDTDEYREATTTPWRSRVMEGVLKRERFLLLAEGSLLHQ
ncbi:hypothetical protein HGRIS_009795 [Hohenbuehelia grisea]|uniref:Uncharacterized protein n=1 Tax=Hohenbuehelia grisea TaxID=104357 RepID=A0ABR3J2M5_9AGAR